MQRSQYKYGSVIKLLWKKALFLVLYSSNRGRESEVREECVSQGSWGSPTRMKASVHSCFCILVPFTGLPLHLFLFYVFSLFCVSYVIYSWGIFNEASSQQWEENEASSASEAHIFYSLLCTTSPPSFPFLLCYCLRAFASLYTPHLLCIVNLPHFLFLFLADTLPLQHTRYLSCFLTCAPHAHCSQWSHISPPGSECRTLSPITK